MPYEIHGRLKTGDPVVIGHDDEGLVGEVYRTVYTFNGQTLPVDVPADTPEVEYGARWPIEFAALDAAGIDTHAELWGVNGDDRWKIPGSV